MRAAGDDEKRRTEFVRKAIREHIASDRYKLAADAELYFSGENPTINRYEKLIYDLQGRARRDMYTANHKIASSFFGFAVQQGVSYLLGNGVSFGNDGTKARLGAGFDQAVIEAAQAAQIAGVAFGFWNYDRLHVFKLTEFVPLYDEENGALCAGIRFWRISADKPLRATLYETDGYTDYLQPENEDMRVLAPKRAYIRLVVSSAADGARIYDGENYPSFPIVPLKNNEKGLSELVGKRNTIDALDLSRSNMVNNVDEGNLIYWVLSNCEGMDDLDDVRFVERLKTLHVAHANGDDGAKAEAHTLEAPFTGTEATIDMLTRALYQDFQCFDASAVTAGNQTATAIRASYIPLDLKTDRFEVQVTRFILGILSLAGLDDELSYTRSRIVNVSEEIQSVLLCAPYLDEDYITQKLLTILGDADRYDDITRARDAEAASRFEDGTDEGIENAG